MKNAREWQRVLARVYHRTEPPPEDQNLDGYHRVVAVDLRPGIVDDGRSVWFEITLPDGSGTALWGEVYDENISFGRPTKQQLIAAAALVVKAKADGSENYEAERLQREFARCVANGGPLEPDRLTGTQEVAPESQLECRAKAVEVIYELPLAPAMAKVLWQEEFFVEFQQRLHQRLGAIDGVRNVDYEQEFGDNVVFSVVSELDTGATWSQIEATIADYFNIDRTFVAAPAPTAQRGMSV